jgi:hypothetical protein
VPGYHHVDRVVHLARLVDDLALGGRAASPDHVDPVKRL